MSLYPCPWAEAGVFSFLSTWNFCFGTLQAPSFLSLFEDERGEAESQLAAHPGQFPINSVACSKCANTQLTPETGTLSFTCMFMAHCYEESVCFRTII